jgi:MFS family permease
LISRWFPPNRQALAIGAVVTMAFLGGTMAHTPLAYLRDHFGWREALIIDGIVGILLIVWISFFVKDSPLSALEDDKPPISNKLSLKKTILTVVKKPQNILAGLYTSLLNLPIMVLCALWGDSYLQHVHHVPPLSSSMIVSLIFLGSMIGCPLMGYLSDRQGKRKPLMWFGSVATFLTLFPLFIFHSLTQTELSMIFCLLGFFTSTQVISYPLIAESNPAYLVGVSTSVASVIIMGGGGLAQVFFGYLMNLHAGSASNYSSQDYGFAMCLFPLSILVTFVVLFFIKETNCQHQ